MQRLPVKAAMMSVYRSVLFNYEIVIKGYDAIKERKNIKGSKK